MSFSASAWGGVGSFGVGCGDGDVGGLGFGPGRRIAGVSSGGRCVGRGLLLVLIPGPVVSGIVGSEAEAEAGAGAGAGGGRSVGLGVK